MFGKCDQNITVCVLIVKADLNDYWVVAVVDWCLYGN
jgi:hypothetical protein